MAQPPLRKIKPGERITGILAETWNAFVDAANDTKRRNRRITVDELRKVSQSGIVPARNDTLNNVQRFGILGVDRPIILQTDNPDEFKRQVAMRCIVPAAEHAVRFVVMQSPSIPQAICSAVASGVVQCQIDVTAASHTFAKAKAGDTAKLISDASSGVPILWKEDGTGTKWAIIRLDSSGDGGKACGDVRFQILVGDPLTRTALCVITARPFGCEVGDIPGTVLGGYAIEVCDPGGCFFNESNALLIGREGWAKYMKPVNGATWCQPDPYYVVPEWEVYSLCCAVDTCNL